MKKVLAILVLVPVVVLSGCKSTPRENSNVGTKSAATSGRPGFWDMDLRPTMAVPPSKPKTRPAEAAAPAESPKESVAKTPIEPAKPVMVPPVEVVTTTVEPVQPLSSGPQTSTFDKVMPVAGTRLVTTDENGGRVLSLTYPRTDFGILQVDKMMPAEVRLHAPFSYILKVTNLTETLLNDVTITETTSKGFEFKEAEPAAQADGNKLTWVISSLAPRASTVIKISGTATIAKPMEQTTAITHTIRGTAAVNVVEPTLAVQKIVPPEALLGESIQVKYVVTNTGTGVADNVQVVDNLPAGMQTADGKVKVVLDAGTLAAGESRQFSVKLVAAKTGIFIGKATALSASGLKAESDAATINVRQPVLAITKSGPRRQYLGRAVSYEITVTNKGDGQAKNTIVDDVLPPGVTNVEATTGFKLSGTKLVWELGTLEPNTSKKVKISYIPPKEGELMASATAQADCAAPVSDSAKTTIAGIAATRLEVVDTDDPVEVGSETTYVITASNEGSAAASNIHIICTLDDKLMYRSSAGATAAIASGKRVIFAPLRTLEPKTKATWRIVVRGMQPGDVRFQVAMSTDQTALPLEQMEATHFYQQNGGN